MWGFFPFNWGKPANVIQSPKITHLHFIVYWITALPEAGFSDTPLFSELTGVTMPGMQELCSMCDSSSFNMSVMHPPPPLFFLHFVRWFHLKASQISFIFNFRGKREKKIIIISPNSNDVSWHARWKISQKDLYHVFIWWRANEKCLERGRPK